MADIEKIPTEKIPVSVIVVTRNEEARLSACLEGLSRFDDVWVVDSGSEDKTCEIARAAGAKLAAYQWDGVYPKKRGWCLQHLDLAQDWIFFVDADEIVTPELVRKIAALDFDRAGYFVKGKYIWNGKMLRYGLCNNKLALFDRRRIEFPVVDDLDIEGMGEIEGHYQPVLKAGCEGEVIGQLSAYLLHDAGDGWEARHQRYAVWEAGMNARGAWPKDPVAWREALKRAFRKAPFRGGIAFLHSYVFRLGFLDGAAGFDFAASRARYYGMISRASRVEAQSGEAASSGTARL